MKPVVEFLESFVVVVLVLAGIAGLFYNLFRDNGWLGTVLGKIWDLETRYPLIAIPVTIGAIIMFRLWWRDKVIHGKTSRLPDFLLYALMAGGAYFIGRYAITGSL
ncbi:MAG: hypothetical protein K2Y16_11585 [Burkholderiales bacterium]|nr:hypothetical protein [Burkholderiales bacterium]